MIRSPHSDRNSPDRARLRVETLEDRTVPVVPPPAGVAPPEYDPSRILVLFEPGVMVPDGSAILPGTAIGPAIGLVPGLRVVSLAEGIAVKQAEAAYRASPLVRDAGPNYAVRASATPNDPLFPALWGMHNTGQTGGWADADIDAPEAWDVTTSSGTLVAVLDTGVDYTHPDLAANIWVNAGEVPGDGLDNDGNGYVDDVRGYDFSGRDNDPMDDNGHGTHVAGTVGAVGNNGVGVAGVAWDVQIMPVKFMNALGFGFESDAITALDYAVANGATVSNNSWGGLGVPDPFLYLAIQNAGAAGHIFVAAAGNDGLDTDLLPLYYPSAFDLDNIVSVAATDHADELPFFSNYGATTVDLGAPGDAILSTVPTSGSLSDPSGYASFSGTSMATPHVAGAVALVRGQHPDWTYRQVIDHVLGTTDLLPALEGRTVTGGRLNVARAVGAAGGPAVVGPYVVASSPDGETPGPVAAVRVTFNEPVDPATFTRSDVVLKGPARRVAVQGVAAVAGSGDRQFDITFRAQTAPGTYRLVLGPRVADPDGNPMDQDRDGVVAERADDVFASSFAVTAARTFSSPDVPRPVIDFVPTVSYLMIAEDLTVADLNVRVDVTHWWVGDLRISLVSPSGTRVVLSEFNGGSGDDYDGTTFDDEASLAVGDGGAPFGGSYRPESPLSALDGQSARGRWELWVEDQGLLADGTLDAWSLIIQPADGSTSSSGGQSRAVAVRSPGSLRSAPAPMERPVSTGGWAAPSWGPDAGAAGTGWLLGADVGPRPEPQRPPGPERSAGAQGPRGVHRPAANFGRTGGTMGEREPLRLAHALRGEPAWDGEFGAEGIPLPESGCKHPG